MKKRVYFNKYNDMKFISHLDLLRFLERILLKSRIPVKYSQGFHPRPKISLGNPISLGTEAFDEVMEIELEEKMTNEEILKRFNSVEVLGFQVIRVEDNNEKTSIVERFFTAIYSIDATKDSIDQIEKFLLQDEIIERKEKKGKIVERDLKEKIKQVLREDEKTLIVYISNGSPNNFIEMAGIKISDVDITKKGYFHG